jgi:hypothetical protein
MFARFVLVIAAAAALGAGALAGGASTAAESELDFEIYRSQVEPVFLKRREGIARCYQCHVEANSRAGISKWLRDWSCRATAVTAAC